MTPTEAVIQCFKDSGPLTFEALVYESELDETMVSEALLRLVHEGRVECEEGAYRLHNANHSRRIKNGLLIKEIPSLC